MEGLGRSRAAALVVGGASGIGRASAEALSAEGWLVTIADLKADESDAAAIRLDVRDAEAVQGCVDEAAALHGPLGAIVYAAGTARVTPLPDIEDREWELVLGVNLTGAFNVIRAAAPRMAVGGAIVLVSSVDARTPVAGLAHYCAAKAGVEALARSAALELADRGIRCNTIAPGVVRTPLMHGTLAQPGIEQAFLDRIPLRRIGRVADVAAAVAFLVSPAAAWITGAYLPVDGGMSLREHPALLDPPDRSLSHNPRAQGIPT